MSMCEAGELEALDVLVALLIGSRVAPTDGVANASCVEIGKGLRKDGATIAFSMRRLRRLGLVARVRPDATGRYLVNPDLVRAGSDRLTAKRAMDFEAASALDREAALPPNRPGSSTV